ncbi:hypothetical protein AU196_22410 [Mycobacterium sp. IS-1742]|uniref:protein phosphatase 2C domain-containing protein n=1 Tax=Mycobacterium sp. IS-1742 TaxID=1772285 RepID=UPI00073FE557|nr:protein phosphatase 2C domain-containing protein [Mycobacterium sp. IS-1742]KUI25572.1 hypothetical protein AU196_22410 [Mycobacterium sp. IS-1742]
MRPGCPDGAPRWAVCGASVTGQEHERRGLGCDDAYSYGVAGDFVVAAVADGAGAVTGTSAWGAYAACQSVLTDGLQPAFIDRFRSGDAEELMRRLFDNALNRVVRQATALGVDPMRLSTTLCVAVADSTRAMFGQIGDGVIAAELPDGRIGSLLIEEKDGYANTTSFLQSDRAFDESFRTLSVNGVTAFALSTDGMSYKITDIGTGEAYEPFFRDSWQHVRAGARADQFAALLRGITDDQTGDDKTMVLAAVSGSAAGAVTDSSPAPGTSDAELETVPLARGARRRGLWRRRR